MDGGGVLAAGRDSLRLAGLIGHDFALLIVGLVGSAFAGPDRFRSRRMPLLVRYVYWSIGETVVRRVREVYVFAAFCARSGRLAQEMTP
jgi:hypothetical protein